MKIIKKGKIFIARKAVKEDENQIQSLIFKVLAEYGFQPAPEGLDADLFDIENYYADGYFWVLKDEEEIIVGTFGLYKLSDSIAEIRKMYLRKKSRGIGLGRWMILTLIEKAREMEFKFLELETASPLVEAIGLYKKMGFTELTSSNQTPGCDKSFSFKL